MPTQFLSHCLVPTVLAGISLFLFPSSSFANPHIKIPKIHRIDERAEGARLAGSQLLKTLNRARALGFGTLFASFRGEAEDLILIENGTNVQPGGQIFIILGERRDTDVVASVERTRDGVKFEGRKIAGKIFDSGEVKLTKGFSNITGQYEGVSLVESEDASDAAVGFYYSNKRGDLRVYLSEKRDPSNPRENQDAFIWVKDAQGLWGSLAGFVKRKIETQAGTQYIISVPTDSQGEKNLQFSLTVPVSKESPIQLEGEDHLHLITGSRESKIKSLKLLNISMEAQE